MKAPSLFSNRSRARAFLFTIALSLHGGAMLAQDADKAIAVPSGVRYQLIGTYNVARLNKILTTEVKEFSDFAVAFPEARYPVKLYRVTYPSVIPEQGSRPTTASGLVAVPDGAGDTLPVISYQHGTVFAKTEVPSHPDQSMETRLMLAQFAGQGYLVVAADYFGKGESTEPDSYLVKASTQQACLDMLRAGQVVSAHLQISWGPLFLSGWSQGGWGTMVFLNKLESLGIFVKGAATASAPQDLFALINRWLHKPTGLDAAYLPALIALQLNAYEQYYGLPGLAAASIKPEYQTAARDLYFNNLTWEQASSKLPKKLGELLEESVITAGSAGDSRYWQILQENQAYRWRSLTPLHIYYGEIDEVVPPYIATLPIGYQQAIGGAETTGVAAGRNANHRGTFLFAVADQKKWFDSLLQK